MITPETGRLPPIRLKLKVSLAQIVVESRFLGGRAVGERQVWLSAALGCERSPAHLQEAYAR